jgi:hypothetical protein
MCPLGGRAGEPGRQRPDVLDKLRGFVHLELESFACHIDGQFVQRVDPARRVQVCWIRSAAVSALTCPRQAYTIVRTPRQLSRFLRQPRSLTYAASRPACGPHDRAEWIWAIESEAARER